MKLTLEVPRASVASARVSVQGGGRNEVPVRDVVVTVSLARDRTPVRGTDTVKLDVPLHLGRGRHRLVVQTDGRPPVVLHQHLFNTGPAR